MYDDVIVCDGASAMEETVDVVVVGGGGVLVSRNDVRGEVVRSVALCRL